MVSVGEDTGQVDTSTLVILGVLVGYAALIYNNLALLAHAVSQAWTHIDMLLKQRHDALPRLVETCKPCLGHEHEALEAVLHARNAVAEAGERGDMGALGEAEGRLRMSLERLFALAEACPELKADPSFQPLQTHISALTDSIADRRDFYNAAVSANNVGIEQFPDLLIARAFGFGPAQRLAFADTEKTGVDTKALFDA